MTDNEMQMLILSAAAAITAEKEAAGVFPSHSTSIELAHRTGISLQKTGQALAELEKSGLVITGPTLNYRYCIVNNLKTQKIWKTTEDLHQTTSPS